MSKNVHQLFLKTGLPRAVGASIVSLGILFPLASYGQTAEPTTRPLGVLIQGSGAAPASQQNIPRGVLPQNVFTPQRTQTESSQDISNPAQDRPLGTLFSSGVPNSDARSVLPRDWTTRSTEPVTAPTSPASTSAAPAARPLGTLINIAPPRSAPQPQPSLTPIAPQRPRRAERVQPTVSTDASDVRPLGTLFGAQTQGETQRPTIGTESLPANATVVPQNSRDAAPNEPIRANLTADSLSYDRELGLIVANGNVEITYDQRVLRADQVTYNQKTDVVTASGNVLLTDQSEELLLGDRMEVTGDLRDGAIYSIGLVLADKSRIAGSGARRSDGTVTDVRNAVYSPCNLCPDDPDAAPLWQVKAVKVVHDGDEKTVTYRNAWIEVFGTPVFYTPYLQHPDPTVRRKSGFLFPSLTSSSDLGFRAQTPYYWAIDEYQDATVTPLVTTDGGSGGYAEYRRNFDKGELRAEGSFVFDDPDEDFRGFIDLESEFHLDRTWRAGLDIETASDDTYMRRYGFAADPVLVSRAYTEGFRGRSYQALNAYAFQDTRADADDDQTPLIVPIYDFNYVGRTEILGGTPAFDFNILNLMRSDGTDTRRLSFRPRLDHQFTGLFSDVIETSASLAMDGYHVSDLNRTNGESFSGVSGRIVPGANITWRRPMIRPGVTIDQTVEPIIGLTLAPNGGNSDKTPNEDSQAVEFDETNLFRQNRFDGIDRIDGGSRINYGLNWVLSNRNDQSLDVFLGQSYRPHVDDTFQAGSGLDDNFSDIVGNLRLRPTDYIDVSYRTQVDHESFSSRRDEVDANIGGKALALNTSYVFLDQATGSEFAGREEISGTLSSQFNRHWFGSLSSRYDIADADLRSVGLNLVYEDECLKLTTNFSRTFFRDRDIQPTDAVTFTLVLKTLGEVTNSLDVN